MPPNVSRKVRACTACQKQKVKCIVEHGHRDCNRCRHHKVTCIFHRDLQTILDEDTQWKTGLHMGLSRLERITGSILTKLNMPDISTHDENGFPTVIDSTIGSSFNNRTSQLPSVPEPSSYTLNQPYRSTSEATRTTQPPEYGAPSYSPPILQRGENAETNGSNDEDVLVSEPMESLYEVTKLNKFRRRPSKNGKDSLQGHDTFDDLIAKGTTSLDEAEELLLMFTQSLNHYLWVGLDERHNSVEKIRRSSPLLLASILTAISMHIPNRTETYDKCYAEFLSLVSQSMFSHTHNLDDIRGLTIAAFWLSDLSWKLSGHAIRIATELELHRSFTKAHLSAEHHERARIWYMLYVCDHHFANAYGRPPMIYESQQIMEHEKFLESPFANTLDYRILSQVALFMILKRIYEDFDTGTNSFSSEKLIMLHNYNIELDKWRLLWEARQKPNDYIGNFPSKGIVLYYQFSKLQLNALSLHHAPLDASRPIDPTVKELINHAITAALNTINLVLEDTSIRRALVGTPLYVHTMLTFACVFLFKLTTKWKSMGLSGLMIDVDGISSLIESVIHCLKHSQAGDRHLIYRIANGLEKMLMQHQQRQNREDNTESTAVENLNSHMAWQDMSIEESQVVPTVDGMTSSWEDMGFFDEFGSGFGLGINQFLNTQIPFGYQS